MFKFESSGFERASEVLSLLEMPPGLRRRFLARMGRMVIAQAKKNISDQRTVDGMPFAPRSPKSDNSGPMLKNLAKGKWIKVFLHGDDKAEVGFLRGVGYVASKHQYGTDEVFKQERSLFNNSPLGQKCTVTQATELIRCGINRPKELIMRNMTVWDGMMWLKNHKEKWTITPPERPFLGASKEQRKVWADALSGDIKERFRAKNYANLLT